MASRSEPENDAAQPASSHERWRPGALRALDLRQEAGNGQSEFVAWVRAVLDHRRISQRALARQAGINHSILSRVLSGDSHEMSLHTAVAITRALGGHLAYGEAHEVPARCAACSPARLR